MTNPFAASQQSWLTRGRLLVGLPLGIGVVVGAAVLVLGVRPSWQALQGLQERRDALLSLQRMAPALDRQLGQAEAELRIAEDQQALLVGLIAGRDKVQTFLALLNQQARASGVQMQRYEPLNPPPVVEGKSRQNNRRSKAQQKPEQPQDPLQALGYSKSSVALAVSGPFGGVQTFLQRMEALELFVESSELELKAVVDQDEAELAQPAAIRTQLTLKLSFYDLVPQPADRSTAAGSNEEPV